MILEYFHLTLDSSKLRSNDYVFMNYLSKTPSPLNLLLQNIIRFDVKEN